MMQDQSRNSTAMPAAQLAADAAGPGAGPARAEAGIATMLAEPASQPVTGDPALAGIAETRAALDRALAIEAASSATDSNLPPEWSVVVGEAVEALARIAAPSDRPPRGGPRVKLVHGRPLRHE